jgi:tetratricopeptide (TPR) repeat protein
MADRGAHKAAGRTIRLAAVGILLAVALGIAVAVGRGAGEPPLPPGNARDLLAAGNYSGARDRALASLKAAPGDGAAQLVLAQAYLELGDGLAADAVLTRAQSAGVSPVRLHAFRGAARLLQGDPGSALSEATLAGADDRVYAGRVRARALAANGDVAAAQQVLAGATDAGSLADLGRIHFDVGDIGGASEAAARAFAADPHNPAVLTLQGEVIRSRYGLVAALPWFEAALKRDGAYPPALIEYAATLGDAGRYRQAVAAARRALRARPGSPQALYLLAVVAARAGNMDLAKTLIERADDGLGGLPAALLLGGEIDAAQGHDELAVAKWTQVLDQQPDNVAVRRLLAAALLRTGDARSALDTVTPIASRGDADSYALEIASRAAWAAGDRPAAATFHDRAISARRGAAGVIVPGSTVATLSIDAGNAPGDPGRVLALIRGLIANGDTGGGVARARGLASGMPGSAVAQLVLGDALALAGRPAEAVPLYTRAADLSFDEPTMLRLVDTLGRLGRSADGARTLALYLAQNPQSVTALRIVGRWQAAASDPATAIATLERVRGMVGNRDAGVLADLAAAYGAAGKAQAARDYARAAYALAPMNVDVVSAYATALARLGDAEGARQLRVKAQALANSG